jgi:hypothetical protein
MIINLQTLSLSLSLSLSRLLLLRLLELSLSLLSCKLVNGALSFATFSLTCSYFRYFISNSFPVQFDLCRSSLVASSSVSIPSRLSDRSLSQDDRFELVACPTRPLFVFSITTFHRPNSTSKVRSRLRSLILIMYRCARVVHVSCIRPPTSGQFEPSTSGLIRFPFIDHGRTFFSLFFVFLHRLLVVERRLAFDYLLILLCLLGFSAFYFSPTSSRSCQRQR